MKRVKLFLTFVAFMMAYILSTLQNVYAQCAMCKTTIENNVSYGETAFASKLNIGIMYLLFAPYLLAVIIGYLWYRNSKENARRKVQA